MTNIVRCQTGHAEAVLQVWGDIFHEPVLKLFKIRFSDSTGASNAGQVVALSWGVVGVGQEWKNLE